MTGSDYHVQVDLARCGTKLLVSLRDALDSYAKRTVLTRMSKMTPLWKQETPGTAHCAALWENLVQLEHTFGDRLYKTEALEQWRTDTFMTRVHAASGQMAAELPEDFTPFPWQLVDATRIGMVGKVLITNEPGTGKSASAVMGLLEHHHRNGDTLPALIVTPASVVESFRRTFERLAPQWRAVAWRGTPKQREKLAGTAEVYVTTFDTMRIDEAKFVKMGIRSLVLDEAHAIKAPKSKRSESARRLAKRTNVTVAMTGTPITKSVDDLWASLNALEPLAWPSKERWVDRYCETGWGYMAPKVIGLNPNTEPELRQALLGAMSRVSKEEALPHLPEKVYTTRYIDIPAAYMKSYKQLAKDMLAELPDGEELPVMTAQVLRTRLRQLASSAADVTTERVVDDMTGEEKLKYHVKLKAPSWKVDALLEIMEERKGQPVVAFSPSRQLIDLAGEAAEEAGYSVRYVVGGQNAKERQAGIDAFRKGEIDLMCVVTSSGGVGLDGLQEASSCAVFLSMPDSLVDAKQAEDRVHRIGSERHSSVEIIRLTARGTIDELIPEQLLDKASQLAEVVQDDSVLKSFTREETAA